MNRAVFIDRDGVINENRNGYVNDWTEFNFIEGSVQAFKELAQSDYKVIVVTNQAGVGRGRMKREDVEDIHARMLAEVEAAGGRIDAVYVCMHHPDEGCSCRKPGTGLVEMASETFNLDISRSWFVGDHTKDIKAGRDSGCRTVAVGTGYGGSDGSYDVKPDYEVENLLEAVNLILST
ncbi:MAG: D-glycero-beta-D-manno-heptose 1,7-bisphosphate 7-phosphatase [Candidatus Altiarchaeales archaeon]|nr:D-glycero-beta-D-manno-heptose 1,7-bisphosphate 7-phosphatase [Candidatus Altiarchaeales archaeon]MBD3415657.1 D-glycero-beta-D-manno-heptose 1,7-bisphosphate 7-phosphatase [Candidatus Altiarchaeales archaeon]